MIHRKKDVFLTAVFRGIFAVTAIVLFFTAFLPYAVFAQDKSETLGIKDIVIDKSGDAVIKISGVLFNPSDSIVSPEVTHLLIFKKIDPLIKPADDRMMLPSLIVAADEGKEFFSLKPNEQKAFSYNLPISPYIPLSNYLVDLRFILPSGLAEIGHREVIRGFGSSGNNGFLAFDQEKCVVLDKEGKKFGNNDGPSFLPGENPEISCPIKNIGDEDIEVFPGIVWKEMFVYGMPSIGTRVAESLGEKLIFKKGETKSVSLFMPKAEKPQAYQGLLSFEDKNGDARSFNMDFRWIISGKSARIFGVFQTSPLKDYYAKGEAISLSVDYFGSADLFWLGDENISELDNLTMKAVVRSKNGSVCGEKEELLADVTDAHEKNKTIDIVLNKKCRGMSYDVSLASSKQELAKESGALPFVASKPAIWNYLYFGIFILAAVLSGWLFLKKKKIVSVHILVPVILLAGFAMFSGAASAVVIKTYPAEGGSVSTFNWGGNFLHEPAGTAPLFSGPFRDVTVNHSVKADFIDYFNTGGVGKISIELFDSNYSCSNTDGYISIKMGVLADGLFEQPVSFVREGGSGFSNEKIINWKHEGGYAVKSSESTRSTVAFDTNVDLRAILYDNTGMPRTNPKFIVYFRRIGVYTKEDWYYSGNFIYRYEGGYKSGWTKDSSVAWNESDFVKVEVPIKVLAPAPIVTLTADPLTIDLGKSSKLSWTSQYADSCTASGGWSGSRGTSGSFSVSPLQTEEYILTCNGQGGSAEGRVTVTVNQPKVTLSVSPKPVTFPKTDAVLEWDTDVVDKDGCVASSSFGDWKGKIVGNKKGTETIRSIWTGDNAEADEPHEFTLTCKKTVGTKEIIAFDTAKTVAEYPLIKLTIERAGTGGNGKVVVKKSYKLSFNERKDTGWFTGIARYLSNIVKAGVNNDEFEECMLNDKLLSCSGKFPLIHIDLIATASNSAKFGVKWEECGRTAGGVEGKIVGDTCSFDVPKVSQGVSSEVKFPLTSGNVTISKDVCSVSGKVDGAGKVTIKDKDNNTVECDLDNKDSSCVFSYNANNSIIVSAIGKSGAVFNDWSGDCSGSTCVLKIDGDKNIGAEFCSDKIIVNAGCREYPDTYITQPAFDNSTGCLLGDYIDDTNDTLTEWKWDCELDGGVSAFCKAAKVVNNPPDASIVCDKVPCEGYKGALAGTSGALRLDFSATDPDNNLSSCNFSVDGATKSTSCGGQYYSTASGITAGSHISSMTAIDSGSLQDTASLSFLIKNDISADFTCSLKVGGPFQENCSTLKAPVNTPVYFRNASVPSEGAFISSYSWVFQNGDPGSSGQENPSSIFTVSGSNNVTLTVIDTAGRSKLITKPVGVGEQLKPLWKEVIPR